MQVIERTDKCVLCEKPVKRKMFIAYNKDKTVVHYGEIESHQCMGTGLQTVEFFEDNEETGWKGAKENYRIEEIEEVGEID